MMLKSHKRGQVGGKESLFQRQATGGGGQTPVQRLTPPLTIRGQELLQTEGGAPCRAPQSTLTLIFKFVTSSLTSIILMVSCTVSFQFQVQFISISFRPVLRIVATMSWLQSGHCVINFFHLVDVWVPLFQKTLFIFGCVGS